MDYSYILPVSFQAELVLLSVAIAFLGTYAGLAAVDRIRAGEGEWPQMAPLLTAAISLGGIGIWGTHFIARHAQWFPFALDYDLGVTLISLLVAVGLSGFALWLAYHPSRRPSRRLVAGGLVGLSIVSAHYIGMAGVSMPILGMQWQPHIVALSVAIGLLSAMVAMWLAFQSDGAWARIGATVCLGAGIAGMHYTATLATTLVCYTQDVQPAGGDGYVPALLAASLMFVTAVVIMLMLSRRGESNVGV